MMPRLPTEIALTSVEVRAWISDYVHVKQSDVITHPYPYSNDV